jgi:hypothetical protein
MKAWLWFLVCLILLGCGSRPVAPTTDRIQGNVRETLSPLKERLLRLALQEWDYFGRQQVIYWDTEESIPHVGIWEDDDLAHSARVNLYWRAVGLWDLTGKDCQQPWSAAFISWLMTMAGVPTEDFPPAAAHWTYVSYLIRHYTYNPAARFVPHTIDSYRPQPGDLICASRGVPAPAWVYPSVQSDLSAPVPLHCDLVIGQSGQILQAIGGNVRNAVSKSILTLDANGYLQPTSQRPWFIVIENRW